MDLSTSPSVKMLIKLPNNFRNDQNDKKKYFNFFLFSECLVNDTRYNGSHITPLESIQTFLHIRNVNYDSLLHANCYLSIFLFPPTFYTQLLFSFAFNSV